jgi:hypothetical protein
MNASAIVALRSIQRLSASVSIVAVIGFYLVSARAESPQAGATAAQAVVAAQQQCDIKGAPVSTVLKPPTTPSGESGAAIQPSATTQQLPGAKAESALPAKAVPTLTNLTIPAGLDGSPIAGTSAAAAVSPSRASSVSQIQIDGLESLTPVQRQTYRRAASAFTVFCHDWERLLHEREVNNLEHLSWRKDGGLEMATYTGYGKVESCQCKESKEGLPIGKILYREMNYSIAGKTIDQARHSLPKLTHEISTMEIFSWDKGKWFY